MGEEKKPIAVCLVRNAEGLIRCTMPDGSTRYVTDEEWPEVYRQQREHAAKMAAYAELKAARRKVAQIERSVLEARGIVEPE